MTSFASGMSGKSSSKPATQRTSLVSSMGQAARLNYDMRDAFDSIGNYEGTLAIRKAMGSLKANGGNVGTARHINTGFRLDLSGVRGSGKGSSGPELLH